MRELRRHRVPSYGAWRKAGLAIALVSLSLTLGACGGGEEEAAAVQNPPPNPPAPPPPSPPVNQPPTITGTPPSQVTQGQAYSFTPSANDPNGDSLTFSITGKPAWATFTASNGRLSGTPTGAQTGTYANIRISVSDGTTTVNLPDFSITVVGTVPNGSVTLSWTPPTQNTDGSPLTNLAGYRVYWGTTQGTYPNSETINVGLSSYVVDQLAPATYYFAVTAVNSAGAESAYSNVASKQVL